VRRLLPPLAAFLLFALGAVVPPPADAAQEAGTPAYIAIGDSIAYGLGVSEPSQQGYVALAFESLRNSDRYEGRGLDLLNLGVPGATSGDLLAEGGQLEAALDEITRRAGEPEAGKVEMISVNIGGNDLLQLARPDSPCAEDQSGEACIELLGQTLIGLQDNLTQTLERLRDSAPEAGVYMLDLYNPYSGTGDSLEGIADLAVQQLNGVIGAVAAEEQLGVNLGDVFHLFRGRGLQWIAEDGLHPNENGHKVIAEVLLATIDGRSPRIPRELLDATPAPVVNPGIPPELANSDSGGIEAWWLLVVVPVAFVSGVAIAVGYFLARGRR
jgi:lysophospholipase L1-like esterase